MTQPEDNPGPAAHYRALERLYRSAPVNRLFSSELSIEDEGRARIVFDVEYLHIAASFPPLDPHSRAEAAICPGFSPGFKTQ